MVNSYFNILVQYGDQYEVLGFRDLIEIKVQSETDLDVDLRNPEYDLTQAVKKALYGYQGAGELFENIPHSVSFKGYISADEKLPELLRSVRKDLNAVLGELRERSAGKLSVDIRDPDTGDGALAQMLEAEFGFRPMATSLFDANTFWFYLTLEGDGRIIQVPLPEKFEKTGLERGLQAALKRFSRGFLKTVALHTLAAPPAMTPFGMAAGGKHFSWLRDTLAEEHNLEATDLKGGQVPNDADLLLLVSPDKLDQKQ